MKVCGFLTYNFISSDKYLLLKTITRITQRDDVVLTPEKPPRVEKLDHLLHRVLVKVLDKRLIALDPPLPF